MICEAWSWSREGFNQKDEYMTKAALIFSILLIVNTLYTWLIKNSSKGLAPLPPGPRGFPLVGNLPFLEPDLNRYFADLAKIYGPIFKVQLGSRLCIVLSSPSIAKEVLKDHDATFANHDAPAMGLASSYGGVDMFWSPYGEHWRMLRKISVTELLSNKRIESLYGIRQREGRKLVQTIESMVGIPIVIHDYVNATLFDILSGMLWSGSLVGEEKKQITSDFRRYSQRLVNLCGEPNISDVFPFLAIFDLQGKGNKMKKLVLWFDKIFDQVIEKRLEMKTVINMDFLQVLLQCRDQVDQKKTPLTITHIKALLQDMMLAGTKTSSTTLEWAFAELMQKPHLMKKAQDELDQVVGQDNIVEESHLPKLPYINALVKETLRLHPAAPLLVPRCPSESCVIGGFLVPKGTKILLNAWAIQRDPEYWDNPLEFRPERFMNSTSDCDYKGTNFSFIPFGSGRRVCVGVPLAEKMIPYLLAKLLHSFQWKMEEGAKLDMLEAFGLELVKKIPLVMIPISRKCFI
ncbi:hypothetical protein AQUCO_01300651v1 [Aquilegia coerulea]|uniref:Cytochrome P450 n=1 Tax=Aquilegia coerulea TaxID=218851 RepID=A0A2G5E2X6_AQUCA|nr:hypothetical protein AQUCO_01300651v1 [Aquilegia coerulea]